MLSIFKTVTLRCWCNTKSLFNYCCLLIIPRKEENDSGTEVDLDKFDVCIHENVITALKEMPEYQEAVRKVWIVIDEQLN